MLNLDMGNGTCCICGASKPDDHEQHKECVEIVFDGITSKQRQTLEKCRQSLYAAIAAIAALPAHHLGHSDGSTQALNHACDAIDGLIGPDTELERFE